MAGGTDVFDKRPTIGDCSSHMSPFNSPLLGFDRFTGLAAHMMLRVLAI